MFIFRVVGNKQNDLIIDNRLMTKLILLKLIRFIRCIVVKILLQR